MFSRKALQVSPSPTMSIDARAKQLRSEGQDIIGFGAGEPDFDTPLHIREAAVTALEQGFTRYTPASGTPELKEIICKKFLQDHALQYKPQQIVVSNGAKHSLTNIFTALLNEGDEVIIPIPYWVSYPEQVKINGGLPVFATTKKEHGYKLRGETLKKYITPRTKALILNSPGNPGGQVYNRAELAELAEAALKYNFYIISDEVYEKLVYDGREHFSIASLGDEIKKQTVVVNGVSKTYAMTGWRIGYTASATEIAALMSGIQSHTTSNPNSIAQRAALAALGGPQDCVEVMRRSFLERRDYALERINKMPLLTCTEPQGAFYLFVNVEETFSRKFKNVTVTDSDHLAALLLEHYLLALVPGKGFGAPGFVRLSYATSLENIRRGLDRLESFLKELQ
ncbi:MAG: pyridoxal phosphate-dependent aminotransferase [Firmicutes bacterium]|nr:pyridoxal phosphate-dependent aminotransferase [Bacillota bacterium]